MYEVCVYGVASTNMRSYLNFDLKLKICFLLINTSPVCTYIILIENIQNFKENTAYEISHFYDLSHLIYNFLSTFSVPNLIFCLTIYCEVIDLL